MSWRGGLRGVVSLAAVGLVLAACGRDVMPPGAPIGATPETADRSRPARIVSLDYCADQFVLKFAERGQIAAVSPDAEAPYAYMREAARGFPQVRPVAEDVLALRPDLVVRSYGGGPRASVLFERAGLPVLDIGWTGSLAEVSDNLVRIADALGAPEEGARVAARLQSRLDAVAERIPEGEPPRVLYMTPGGVTSGPGSLVHDLLRAAGLENFQTEPGWRPLPLERLAQEQPDLVARAVFGSGRVEPHRWSAARHPLARQQTQTRPVVTLPGAWTACGGWFLADAVEALAREAPRPEMASEHTPTGRAP